MIAEKEPFSYLKANTILFAEKMCRSIRDMCGLDFTICKESLTEGTFSTPYNVILFTNFSGAIQGNYIISFDDSVGKNILNSDVLSTRPQLESDAKREYCGILKEALNIAVGQAIEELGKSFNNLAYSPVTVVVGEIEFPSILSAGIAIEGREGKILCSFAINLANLKIGEMLEKSLRELERLSNEYKELNHIIDSALGILEAGWVFTDKEGNIVNGLNRMLTEFKGSLKPDNIVGKNILDIIGIPDQKKQVFKQWFDYKYSLDKKDSLNSTRDPFLFTTSAGSKLKLYGKLFTTKESGISAKLLIVIKKC